MREASTLDPTDADLAYQLARAYETGGAGANAAKEYCRFLALAPNAPEAAEARARITVLAPPATNGSPTIASSLFSAGVAAFEKGQIMEAEAKFAAAIKAEPAWADAYYDRALARAALGDRQEAASDLEEYLRLKPEAGDRVQVVAQIETLRRKPVSPPQVLGLGLIIPGAGQFYTGRPLRGAVFLAGATAAIAFGLQQQTKTELVTQTAIDPFGNPYEFTTTVSTKERSNLIPGLLVAGAIAAGGAIEAFSFARRNNAGARNLSVSLTPSGNGFTARVSLLLR